MIIPHRHPLIVVRYDTDLLQGGRKSSAQVDKFLPWIRVENGRNQNANFVCINAEGSRKTSQGLFELSL